MKILSYKPGEEKYGFILFSAKFGDRWESIKEEDHIFIYSSDFEHITESVKSIYPFADPETKEIQEFFDACGMNCIPAVEWSKILIDLYKKEYKDIYLQRFIENFCNWIMDKKSDSDEIMIWGTL